MNEGQITIIREKVNELIADDPKLFLVEVRIRPTNNIKVFIDGDEGISIDRLVQFNRTLYRQLEEMQMFPAGDFSLELSSPGLDEPLKMYRQYQKNVGRYVEVADHEGGRKEGKLVEVIDSGIVLEEEKGKNPSGKPGGKKPEIIRHAIPFDQIKTTRIQIKF